MGSLDGDDCLARWLSSSDPQITLTEGDSRIVLRRDRGALLLGVQLTQQVPANAELENWMRLGAASLNHFPGALAQDPAHGALWLLGCLHDEPSPTRAQTCLEALLNQRDTWRAVMARLARPARAQSPTSRHPLSH
ncbi:type III secretion protein [Pseudomonas sp. MWU13-2517]|uniref:type III secretion protein n=1 Tax=Pseudomonas sp. MWU13-2517 TaxID=2929055 RepID=UPI00200C62F6|nr:type III secretion protein [Pseudomonas sp. MWU13-2517]